MVMTIIMIIIRFKSKNKIIETNKNVYKNHLSKQTKMIIIINPFCLCFDKLIFLRIFPFDHVDLFENESLGILTY